MLENVQPADTGFAAALLFATAGAAHRRGRLHAAPAVPVPARAPVAAREKGIGGTGLPARGPLATMTF